MDRNTRRGYGSVAIAFHWTMALLIIGMIALGLYMSGLPKSDSRDAGYKETKHVKAFYDSARF